MEPVDGSVLDGIKLLWTGVRMYRSHASTYLLLMIVPVFALLLMALLLFFMVASDLPGKNLHEVWMGMGTLQKLGVVAMFFFSLAVFYRALAASILVTREFSFMGEIGAIQAFRSVRWKYTRLFWLMMVSLFFGPLAPFAALIAGLFFAPAFPVAVLEDLSAFQALKRGQKLGAGNQLRIVTIYIAYLVAVVAVGLALFRILVFVRDHFGQAWYTKLVPAISYLVLFTVVQWYMIVLTLNYLQQRKKWGESQPSIAPA